MAIEYAYAEENEQQAIKEKILKQLQSIHYHLDSFLASVVTPNDKPEVLPDKIRINVHSLMRDIKKKYGKHDDIRKEIDTILDGDETSKAIDIIVKSRNDGAHAGSAGERREVNQVELNQMFESLKLILNRLANVGALIKEIS